AAITLTIWAPFSACSKSSWASAWLRRPDLRREFQVTTRLENLMPLLDHFRPPLRGPRRWEGFHHAWAANIAQHLNREVLPAGYFAESEISMGPTLEIDVAN